MKKRIVLGIVLTLICISLVYAKTEKEYRKVDKDKYEVWQSTETVDIKELQSQLDSLSERLNILIAEKNQYLNDCFETCQYNCETEWEVRVDIAQHKISILEEKLAEIETEIE